MGTNQQAAICLLFVPGNDIGTFQNGAVIAFQVSMLLLHQITKTLKLLYNPLSTALMCLAVHGAWPKTTLSSTESIG